MLNGHAVESPFHSLVPNFQADMDRVEQFMRFTVSTRSPHSAAMASHLILAGGKRIRPQLALCSASCARPGATGANDRVITAAAAVELLHIGSLYHDDVIDEASVRRSVESVNSRWGNIQAVLGGDLLLALSAKLTAELGAAEAAAMAQTLEDLCEGQIQESCDLFNVDRDVESYYLSINQKTASLFATSCFLGALEATGDPDDDAVSIASDFGRDLGMAFQIVDDILDFIAVEEISGKAIGTDVAEGVYTLPTIVALRDQEVGGALRAALAASDHELSRSLVAGSEGIGAALATADEYAQRAVASMTLLGAREVGYQLREYVVAPARALVGAL